MRRNENAAQSCPFKTSGSNRRCTKVGGVCSLRLYEGTGEGTARTVSGNEGDLRTVCPNRFEENGTIYKTVGEQILGIRCPRVVREVGFLQRPREASSGSSREDVGKIDNVLVDPERTDPMNWCALEIQAVYFSGATMTNLFRLIRDCPHEEIPFPDAIRRPDYRSSGPKRLMPQLQIKVPTLRRWGKKMAVVVDEAFFRNLGHMETVDDLSSCDIAWFVMKYEHRENGFELVVGDIREQTLERAVKGLTGGLPVSLSEFERKISEKLAIE